jgi:hypothetical protein
LINTADFAISIVETSEKNTKDINTKLDLTDWHIADFSEKLSMWIRFSVKRTSSFFKPCYGAGQTFYGKSIHNGVCVDLFQPEVARGSLFVGSHSIG